ncbi:adenine specific methyltransferase mboiiA [Caudoviricetes sp.]|nr:adenine specific methyltransferase mboiiA [Caudoviricetes sp.]
MIDGARVLNDHVLSALRSLEPESVDCCVTSPPYWGLRSYGTDPQVWGGSIDCSHDWDVLEATHSPGRDWDPTSGNSKVGRSGTAAGQAGAPSFRCSICGAWLGHLGLEPTPDLYAAHLVEVFQEVRRVLKPDGILWLNLGDSFARSGNTSRIDRSIRGSSDGCVRRSDRAPIRIGAEGLKRKDLVGIPWLIAFALRADGWYLRSDVIWSKPNAMPQSVKDRPTSSHEYVFLLSKSERYYYDASSILEPFADQRRGADGSRAPSERNRGGRADGYTNPNGIDPSANGGRNARSVWEISTKPYKGAHFAVFPRELPKRCILAGSREGGTVLDPFAGSGTTLEVALSLSRRAIGIELNPEYVSLIHDRLAAITPGLRFEE